VAGLTHLIQVDPDLRRVYRELGPPPLWPREPGFATLIHIILEQQVSLASAKAAFDRLELAIGPITPKAFLKLNDLELLKIGFSRQKSAYCRNLSEAVLNGVIALEELSRESDDAAVRSELIRLKGIGTWTADIYLLLALRRPDVWPVGDLALAVALCEVKRLEKRPGPGEMEELAIKWRPFRAIAARLLWHHYLSVPRSSARRSNTKT
jgi:DNA-3-methyladenine glycosylase II